MRKVWLVLALLAALSQWMTPAAQAGHRRHRGGHDYGHHGYRHHLWHDYDGFGDRGYGGSGSFSYRPCRYSRFGEFRRPYYGGFYRGFDGYDDGWASHGYRRDSYGGYGHYDSYGFGGYSCW